MRKAYRHFDRLLTLFFSPRGLKPGYWYYLRVLWLQDGLTQKELSDLTNVMETTTVTMLAGMEADGLIERRRNKDDRRKVNVSLTRKGRALEDELMPYAIEINSIATAGIAKERVQTCLAVLSQMADNMARFEKEGAKRPE
ncbi:MAG: winged helix-turn-helix transcriptional regulator [Hyphomonadaceae bacterium]|nr:winged helix-turn-helix transcriptional regulator [Hyphomonadaceae bacterium]